MYRIGISTCGKPMNYEEFCLMKEAGIEAIEVCGGKPYETLDFEQLKRDADAAGIELWSIHNQLFPGKYAYMSSLDPYANERWIANMKELIDRASAVGIDKFVIHPADTPEPYDRPDREERMKHSMECISILADYAYTKNSWIALENLPRTVLCNRAEEHLKMLNCNEKVRACFDFNHSLIQPTEHFIRTIADKIITVHVSDRDNINERHWLPGEGVVEWKVVMDEFEKIGYQGVWMYEVSLNDSATIDRRKLTYKDIVENAKALFRRETPVKIGTPKPNLGLWGPKLE